MIDVTVDGDTWHRGERVDSLLLNGFDRRCCLGFVGSACGYTDEQLRFKATPALAVFDAHIAPNLWPANWVNRVLIISGEEVYTNSSSVQLMITVNDDHMITDTERCIQLTALGLEAGVRFRFINVPGVST